MKKNEIYLEDPKAIQTYPDFENAYPLDMINVENISKDMKKNGYDKARPVVIAVIAELGFNKYLCEGHQRRRASIMAGLIRVPCIDKQFNTIADVMAYISHEQRDRRNLDDKARVKEIENNREAYDIAPNKKIFIAELLGVSERTAIKYKKIMDDPVKYRLVMNDEETINSVQSVEKKKKSPVDSVLKKIEKDFTVEDIDALYDRLKKIKRSKKR